MIYDFPEKEAPIRQGDIFVALPRFDLSLKRMPVVCENEETVETSWRELVGQAKPATVVVGIRAVAAIVISQDCDAMRAPDISLCEIRPFSDVERKSKDTRTPKKWVSLLTQHARINQKWFYLPPDDKVGFATKMGVDLLVTLRIPRLDLEELRDLRKARLNTMAEAHFRERLGEFFRRYPHDEWYALSKDELAVYRKDYPDAEPYPWQST